jgi:REP element-mobilizing transposase RayT
VTAPRQVLPGRTYLVTRRCSQRQFLLRPGKLVNQVFLYVLAIAARRYGIQVHAYCVLSNHYHLVVTDPSARLPAFTQFLDSFVARALNALHGRWDHFWSSDTYSAVALAGPEDTLAKAVYVLANPVAAGLVRSPNSWPGLWSGPEAVGTTLAVKRPAHFFDPDGHLPETAKLRIAVPPGFESAESFTRALAAALAERVERERHSGKVFLGRARVLAQRPSGRPAGIEPRRDLRPRIAARDKWKRVEILERLAEFSRAYREAWAERCAGNLAALFPAGTYLLRVLHGVPCAACG